jgi:hypothetical protein
LTDKQLSILGKAARVGAFLWRYRWAVAVLAVAVAVTVFWKACVPSFGERSVTVGRINITDISPTRKLKVLSWYKEVMVSQTRQDAGIFGYDEEQICAICPARLDLGFDLSECDSVWYVERNDSVWVTLPPVTILNRDRWLVSDAERRIPIEQGKWSAAEKKDLSTRANALMLFKCEKNDCWSKAEEQGRRTVTDILSSLGKKNISVRILPRRRSPRVTLPASLSEAQRANPYRFFTLSDGTACLRYQNGSHLYYKGLSYAELFAVAELYYTFHSADHYTVTRNGQHVDFIHKARAAAPFPTAKAPLLSEQMAARNLLTILHRDVFLSAPLSFTWHEQDRYGRELWSVGK